MIEAVAGFIDAGRARFIAVDGNSVSGHSDPVVVDSPPVPIIDEPNAAGGTDYATAARAILAEIGTEMRHCGSAARLASWAGVCPGMRKVRASGVRAPCVISITFGEIVRYRRVLRHQS